MIVTIYDLIKKSRSLAWIMIVVNIHTIYSARQRHQQEDLVSFIFLQNNDGQHFIIIWLMMTLFAAVWLFPFSGSIMESLRKGMSEEERLKVIGD